MFQSVHQALKVNGRFVAEFGGQGNIATLLQAMQDVFAENLAFGQFQTPWFFPSVEEYQALFEQAVFHANSITLIPRPTPLTSGIEKWLEIFAEGITSHLSQVQKRVFLDAVKTKNSVNYLLKCTIAMVQMHHYESSIKLIKV